MTEEVIIDDIYHLKKELIKKKFFEDSKKERFLVFTDQDNLNIYFMRLIDVFKAQYPEKFEYEAYDYRAINCGDVLLGTGEANEMVNAIFLYSLEMACNIDFINSLQQWLSYFKEIKTVDIIIGFIIPKTVITYNGITAYSENEIESVLCKNSQNYTALKLLIEEYPDVNIKKFFLANILDDNCELLKEVLQKAFHGKTPITNKVHYSISYIRDSILAMIYILKKGIANNSYNIVSFNVTDFQLVSCFTEEFKDYSLEFNFNNSGKEEYFCLNSKKLQNLGWSSTISLRNAIYRTGTSLLNCDYQSTYDEKIYSGKLRLIRKLEIEILREIDFICRKYNIKYFLVGGSLLGAVRHRGFIPWDDDLDVGMLRNDYEKFRSVCSKELSDQYVYQSYAEEKASHYIFDKIRIKDTIFSTKFSAKFDIENGVFLDILVYDQTSNIKTIQKIHIALIQLWKRAINVKWVNYPRKNIHYRLTKVLLPVMRKIPFIWFHNVFEKILRAFNGTESDFLIDGVGMNLKRGPFPKKWFDQIIYVDFENMKVPIPKNYHEYLTHWYGEKYMEVPVISKRSSGHTVYQLDLGKYVLAENMMEGNE